MAGIVSKSKCWYRNNTTPLVHKQYLSFSPAHARGTVSLHHVSVLPTTWPALTYGMQDSAKTRRMNLLIRNNPIPLIRIPMRSLISVVALNDAICAKMS